MRDDFRCSLPLSVAKIVSIVLRGPVEIADKTNVRDGKVRSQFENKIGPKLERV